ncbi:MAG: alanine--glyoxylate aminotransferase family protein [Clostridiales bacterium]|nr:alanine--glyoxylate aminotransferase family protein [Clostridiales bacterium]
MSVPFVLTPGPTYISGEVREVLGRELTNPDIDPNFYEFYKNVCTKLQKLMKTENEVLILAGEGILGLEAACCSLTEEGDRVLIIDNGIFGAGFEDFVKLYGGETVVFKSDYRNEIDVNELKTFLERDHNFKYATIVHCETPSGIKNPVDKICPLLKEYGILSVVDSVSGMGGDKLETDKWQIDIALGGSQKCLSAPVGLTFLSLSKAALDVIYGRKTPVKSFYSNLAAFKDWYKNKWFPYTMPIHLIYALDKALDRTLSGDFVNRHKVIAEGIRYAVKKAGLEIYAQSGFSNTVTAVLLPESADFPTLQKYILEDFGILAGSSLGYLENKVIRIGHMGENCTGANMYRFLTALTYSLEKAGVKLKTNLQDNFKKEIEKNGFTVTIKD